MTNTNPNRIKNRHASEYGGVYSEHGLNLAKQHLAEAKAHRPVDSTDQRMKELQIEMLQEVIRKNTEGVESLKKKDAEIEQRAKDAKAANNAKRKAEALERLRTYFPGSDEEFEAQADQLYAEYQQQQMKERMAIARSRVRI